MDIDYVPDTYRLSRRDWLAMPVFFAIGLILGWIWIATPGTWG